MEQEFLEKMVDVLDCEQEITMDTALDEIEEWDSLSFISFMAMASSTYDKKLVSSNVRGAKTVCDLYELVK